MSSGPRLPGADVTMKRRAGSLVTICRTFRICAASATLLPPNLQTLLAMPLPRAVLDRAAGLYVDFSPRQPGFGPPGDRLLAALRWMRESVSLVAFWVFQGGRASTSSTSWWNG